VARPGSGGETVPHPVSSEVFERRPADPVAGSPRAAGRHPKTSTFPVAGSPRAAGRHPKTSTLRDYLTMQPARHVRARQRTRLPGYRHGRNVPQPEMARLHKVEASRLAVVRSYTGPSYGDMSGHGVRAGPGGCAVRQKIATSAHLHSCSRESIRTVMRRSDRAAQRDAPDTGQRKFRQTPQIRRQRR
jgi:hypothetical protein